MGIRNIADIEWLVDHDKGSIITFLKEICENVGWCDNSEDSNEEK